MPCWTISTVTVLMAKMQTKLLMEALTELKWSPRQDGNYIAFQKDQWNTGLYNKNTGEVTLEGQWSKGSDATKTVNTIKQYYSKAVVHKKAKLYGWKVVQTAAFKYHITK